MKLQKNESKKAPVEIVSHHCELFNGAFSIYNPFGLNSRLVSWMGCPRKFKPRQKLLSSWIRFFSFVSFHLHNKRYLSTSVLNWMICSPHGFTKFEIFYKFRPVASGGAGGDLAPPPQFLADQFTRSWPAWAQYPHPLLLAPTDFQTLRRAWLIRMSLVGCYNQVENLDYRIGKLWDHDVSI